MFSGFPEMVRNMNWYRQKAIRDVQLKLGHLLKAFQFKFQDSPRFSKLVPHSLLKATDGILVFVKYRKVSYEKSALLHRWGQKHSSILVVLFQYQKQRK